MSSPKFERVKRNNPGLSAFLDSLYRYISGQLRSGQEFILPKLAAVALDLRDGEAFVLLEKLAQGQVLKRVYNVYCRRTDDLLATVETQGELDNLPSCNECGEVHDPSDLRVEIAFRPADEDLLGRVA